MEMYLSNLEAGQEYQIPVLVQKVEKATAKNKSNFERLYVRDQAGIQSILYNWNEPFAKKIPIIINARVQAEANKGFRLNTYGVNETLSKELFIPKPQINMKAYWEEITHYVKELPYPLNILIGRVLMEKKKKFLFLPLTASKSFSRTCGILEATLKLTKIAKINSEILGLDQSMAIAGALIYYIGCTDCIDDTFTTTENDTLVGVGAASYAKLMHQVYQIQDSEDEEQKKSLQEVDISCLSNILLSRSKGINTAIPEAVLLRNLDLILRDSEFMKTQVADIKSGDTKLVSGLGMVFKK